MKLLKVTRKGVYLIQDWGFKCPTVPENLVKKDNIAVEVDRA